MSRFQVRRLDGGDDCPLYRIYDGAMGRYRFVFSDQQLAERCRRRLEAEEAWRATERAGIAS